VAKLRLLWSRSVRIDAEGLAWSYGGVRADFIYALFMQGFSMKEIAEGTIDGFTLPTRYVEDAIRYGRWRDKQKATQHKCDEPKKEHGT
jgi:hypothetical protein